MKQKDIALIIVVVAISGVVSFFVAKALFATSKDQHLKAESVQPITTEFAQPSNKYFNAQSIDPTQQISIGGTENNAPFGSAAH